MGRSSAGSFGRRMGSGAEQWPLPPAPDGEQLDPLAGETEPCLRSVVKASSAAGGPSPDSRLPEISDGSIGTCALVASVRPDPALRPLRLQRRTDGAGHSRTR